MISGYITTVIVAILVIFVFAVTRWLLLSEMSNCLCESYGVLSQLTETLIEKWRSFE